MAQTQLKRFPWVTLGLLLGLFAVHFSPLSMVLIYDREAVQAGDWWRIFSGFLCHYSVEHLAWNLVVVLVWGVLLELTSRSVLLWLILLFSLSHLLLLWRTDVLLYAGTSGLAVALVSYVCLDGMLYDSRRSLWATVFVLLVGKISYEFLSGNALFVSDGFKLFPQDHLVGFILAVFLAAAGWLKGRGRNADVGGIYSDLRKEKLYKLCGR